jgi:hypothetical protein
MRTITFATALITGLLSPSLFADWQDQAPKGGLINQLQAAYPLTVMDATGYKVSKPGTTFEIQLDGIQANPMKSPPFQNTFEDGQVVAGGHSLLSKGLPGGFRKSPFAAPPRTLAAKEKAYLVNMEAKNDAVIFTLQTCGTCDPTAVDPSHKPFVASISFKFIKGFLANTNLKQLKDAISVLLVVPDAAAATDAAQTPPAAQQQQTQAAPPPPPDPPAAQKFNDIPPPPPPAEAPAPVNLAIGLTVDQVVAQLGQPINTVVAGDKKIYLYKEWKVTFTKGKISDVDAR